MRSHRLPTAAPATSHRRRRDRHGRGPRGPLAWPAVPAMRSRRDAFDELVLDALERVEARATRPLDSLEVAVEDIPPSDPSSWEESVPLGRLFPADGRSAARLVVYRRPVVSRALHEDELRSLVEAVVIEQVASLLGLDPDDLEGPA